MGRGRREGAGGRGSGKGPSRGQVQPSAEGAHPFKAASNDVGPLSLCVVTENA